MKKKPVLIIAILAAAFAICADVPALEWKTANQVTIQWDAKTELSPGVPIPAGNEIKYNVYLANAITDPDKTNPALLTAAPIAATEFTITLGLEGKYIAGISAVRYDNGEPVDESEINWSDVNGEFTPDPFGLRYYIPMEMPKNLR